MMFDVYNELHSSSKYTHDFPNLLHFPVDFVLSKHWKAGLQTELYFCYQHFLQARTFCPKYTSFAGTPDHYVICINVCGWVHK